MINAGASPVLISAIDDKSLKKFQISMQRFNNINNEFISFV